MISKAPHIVEILKERLDHADAHPVVPFAPNGDRNPITVEHSIMDQILRIEAFQAPGWAPLVQMRKRPEVAGSLSTEYAGLWIRSILKEFELNGGG